MATVMRFAASDVEEGVVQHSGHWIMEENPKATIALVRAFLGKGWDPLANTRSSLIRRAEECPKRKRQKRCCRPKDGEDYDKGR